MDVEGRIDPVTSLVASTFFPAPVFGLREQVGGLATALQSEFGQLGLEVAEFALRLDSPKPAEWWIGSPFLFRRAQLWVGIYHAQITLWSPSKGDEDLVVDMWSRLERAVAKGFSTVDAARRELAFHGHYPVPSHRLRPEPTDESAKSLGRVTFLGRLVHLDSAGDAESKVLLDRSTELADALYLWVHSRWTGAAPPIRDAVLAFSELTKRTIEWAGVAD